MWRKVWSKVICFKTFLTTHRTSMQCEAKLFPFKTFLTTHRTSVQCKGKCEATLFASKPVAWSPLHFYKCQVCVQRKSLVLSWSHLPKIVFLYTKQDWCGYGLPNQAGLGDLTFIQNEYLYAIKHWIIGTSQVSLYSISWIQNRFDEGDICPIWLSRLMSTFTTIKPPTPKKECFTCS